MEHAATSEADHYLSTSGQAVGAYLEALDAVARSWIGGARAHQRGRAARAGQRPRRRPRSGAGAAPLPRPGVSVAELERLRRGFVAHGRAYGEQHGIEYATWREVGVPAGVLHEAGITLR